MYLEPVKRLAILDEKGKEVKQGKPLLQGALKYDKIMYKPKLDEKGR